MRIASLAIASCSVVMAAESSLAGGVTYPFATGRRLEYSLRFGDRTAVRECNVTVTFEPADGAERNAPGARTVSIIRFKYRSFDVTSDNYTELLTRIKAAARRVRHFEYVASVDEECNVVSSNIAHQLKSLEVTGRERQLLLSNVLTPAIVGTWCCLLPRIERLGSSRTGLVDRRNWGDFGPADLAWDVKSAETGARLHTGLIEAPRGVPGRPKVVWWFDITKKVALRRYGADRDVTVRRQLEVRFDDEKKVVTRASLRVTTVEKLPAEDAPRPIGSPWFFEATLVSDEGT